MTTLDDLYVYYCRRCGCRANSALRKDLQLAYETEGKERVLRTIDLSSNYVGPRGFQPVVLLLANLHTVEVLNARNNMLTNDSIRALTEALNRHGGIKEIDLGRNAFGDDAIDALLELLRTNWRITELALDGNNVSPSAVARVESQLLDNRQAVLRALEKDELLTQEQRAILVQRDIARYTPWISSLSITVESNRSGGSLHYASWRENAQHHLYVSHSTKVTITLSISDPLPTRLVGFALLRGEGLLRVVDVTTDPSVVMAESAFSDTSCIVTLSLEANPRSAVRPYVIVPFTFAPGKPFRGTLTAAIASEIDGGFVKLEAQDPRSDWYTQRIEGHWSSGRCGGALSLSTWRESTMYRIRSAAIDGKELTGRVRICFVLSKAVDDDDNDDRSIGLYLLAPDAKGRRPLRAGGLYPGSVIAASDHRREATITYRFDMPLVNGRLDFFLLPSTLEPHQTGSYTCTVYSTCDLEVEMSPYCMGWATQHISNGLWDEARCGGSRADNPTTWIHNPCYTVTVSGETSIDFYVQMVAHVTGRGGSSSETRTRPHGAFSFDDVSVLFVKANDDRLTPVAQAPWLSASVGPAELWVNELDPGEYLMVPVTRVAGHTGSYELTVVSSRAVHIDSEVPLAARLRHAQLQKYDRENSERRLSSVSPRDTTANVLSVSPDAAIATTVREAAVRTYQESGSLFTDRDFPRGPSSLFKNAVSVPVKGTHPAVYDWKRPNEIFARPTLHRGAAQRGAIPQGYDTSWLHSALAVVASRPELLRQLIATELPQYGLYQFAFCKAGAWRIVTIDDYLPVDAVDALCMTCGVDGEDVLAALVEKAYAKLHRCYEALDLANATTAQELQDGDCTSPGCHAGYSIYSRALQDFTGGLATERRLYDPEEKAWIMKGMWSHLLTCRSPDCVMAFRLSAATPRASEKKEYGLYLDRLYPVLDAREVEGHKLIKLANFWGWGLQGSGAHKTWPGKWRVGSPNWTSELIAATSFDPNDSATFWVSVDEAVFYFGVLHTVQLRLKSCWVTGAFGANAAGGDLLTSTWPSNPQYALRVHSEEQEEGPVIVVVGVHQPDALLHLTRDDTSCVEYHAALGVSVIRTTDDQRKLRMITDKELPLSVDTPLRHARDTYYSVTYDPRYRYIIMPFNGTSPVAASYQLSAWCTRPSVTLSLIASDHSVALEGEWAVGSAGGPPSAGTWRDNPHYLMFVAEATTVTIVLRQRNELCSTADYIGFTVLEARSSRRVMRYDETAVIANVSHQNTHAVMCDVAVRSSSERLGMPYVIVPSLSVPNVCTGFTIEVISNARVSLRPLDKELDYYRRTISGRIDHTLGNAGGSLAFSSWRSNPQYTLTFPVSTTGTLFVSIQRRHPVSDDEAVGVVALKSDEWDHGRRRKVQLNSGDVIASSPSAPGGFAELKLDFDKMRHPLIIMPFAERPFSSLDYELTFYCTVDLEVAPVSEWVMGDVAGSWELGLTAGGCRARHRSWVNNPFFALSVTRPTRVTLLALQYPRGPEKPIVRRVGPNRVLVPPPIVNSKTKVCFGVDLCTRDAGASAFEVIESTKHTFDGEVCLTRVLEACTTEPYYVVPHTYDAEEEADFRVILYADQPVQLIHFEQGRKTY